MAARCGCMCAGPPPTHALGTERAEGACDDETRANLIVSNGYDRFADRFKTTKFALVDFLITATPEGKKLRDTEHRARVRLCCITAVLEKI